MKELHQKAAEMLVFAHVATHENENAVHTWWKSLQVLDLHSQRERARSEVEDSMLVRPYSSCLEKYGESVVVCYNEPTCVYSKRWGRLVVFEGVDDVVVVVRRHTNFSMSTHTQEWDASACMHLCIHLTQKYQTDTWPTITVLGWGTAGDAALGVAKAMCDVVRTSKVNLWLLAPVVKTTAHVSSKIHQAYALLHGSDNTCTPVGGTQEIWLPGMKENRGLLNLDMCCSRGRITSADDPCHTLKCYSKGVVFMLTSSMQL